MPSSMAAKNGHLEMVQYLMTLPGVDPTAQDNAAIRWASRRKHEEIVKTLALSSYYNPFKQDITSTKQEERINVLNNLIEKEYVIKVLEEANPKFTCLLLNYSFFSGNKDIDKLIAKAAIAHDLQRSKAKLTLTH